MKITVTQENIDKGNQGSYDFCPIALALRDKGYILPFVCGSISAQDQKHYRHTWSHSRRSLKFMSDFDKNRGVKPSTFILKEDK